MSNQRISTHVELLSPKIVIKEFPLSDVMQQAVCLSRDAIARTLRRDSSGLIVIILPDDELNSVIGLTRMSQEVRLTILSRSRAGLPQIEFVLAVDLGALMRELTNQHQDYNRSLRDARKLLRDIAETGVTLGSLFEDPMLPQYFCDLMSWGCFRSQEVESQLHRQLASGCSFPVAFSGTQRYEQSVRDAILSTNIEHSFFSLKKSGVICVVHTEGNETAHVVLDSMEEMKSEWLKDMPMKPLVIVSPGIKLTGDTGAAGFLLRCSRPEDLELAIR